MITNTIIKEHLHIGKNADLTISVSQNVSMNTQVKQCLKHYGM